jgi:hypothetical protein
LPLPALDRWATPRYRHRDVGQSHCDLAVDTQSVPQRPVQKIWSLGRECLASKPALSNTQLFGHEFEFFLDRR